MLLVGHLHSRQRRRGLPDDASRVPLLLDLLAAALRSGQPIPVSATGYVQVTLMPDVTSNQEYTTRQARCEKDGSFKKSIHWLHSR